LALLDPKELANLKETNESVIYVYKLISAKITSKRQVHCENETNQNVLEIHRLSLANSKTQLSRFSRRRIILIEINEVNFVIMLFGVLIIN
jgi:hypothetical protein